MIVSFTSVLFYKTLSYFPADYNNTRIIQVRLMPRYLLYLIGLLGIIGSKTVYDFMPT